MSSYDFDEFLQRMSRLNTFDDVLRAADKEGSAADGAGTGGHKGVVSARKHGVLEYARKIGAFLFFMRFGRRPTGVCDQEFRKYAVVVRTLVTKGELKPDILKLFKD